MLQTFSISRVVTVLILLKSLPKSLPISALYQHTFIRAMPRLWAAVLISAWMPWRFSLCLCVAPWQTDTVKDTLLHYSLLQRAEALWCWAAFLLCCWLMHHRSLFCSWIGLGVLQERLILKGKIQLLWSTITVIYLYQMNLCKHVCCLVSCCSEQRLNAYSNIQLNRLEHKSSVKSLGYICSNSQKYIVWVKIIHFLLCQKSLGY